MTGRLLTRQQIVERLNVSHDWFCRNRRRLEAEGFPESLPGFKRGRWCPQAVEAWIARHASPPAPQEPEPQAAVDPQEALRQALQDRAQAIASSGKRTWRRPACARGAGSGISPAFLRYRLRQGSGRRTTPCRPGDRCGYRRTGRGDPGDCG